MMIKFKDYFFKKKYYDLENESILSLYCFFFFLLQLSDEQRPISSNPQSLLPFSPMSVAILSISHE